MSAYSFTDTQVSITGPGGSYSLKGGVSEEGIAFTMDEDKVTKQMGANGDWLYSLHAGKGASLTISVLKNSPTNSILSTMYNLQQTSSSVCGTNTIKISTLSGDSITLSGVAFKKHPDVSYAKDATLNVWSMDVGRAEIILADVLP